MRPHLPYNRPQWLFLCVGAGLLVLCLHSLWYGFTSERWPRVDAVMEVSTESHWGTGRTLPRVQFRYRYEVGGRSYTGERWRYKLYANTADSQINRQAYDVSAAVASYPPGSTVKVAVNPSDPADAVLEPGMSIDDQVYALFGLALVAIAILPGRPKHAAPAHEPHGRQMATGHRHATTAGVLIVVASILLLVGGYVLYRNAAGSFWPSATGKVLYRQLGTPGQPSATLRAYVRYEYEVDGSRYLGTAGTAGMPDAVKAWFTPKSVGAPVTVYYNPLDHGDSMVDTGVTWHDLGLPVLAVSLFGLAQWLRRRAAR